MVTSLYLFFVLNWCLSYNEITLLQTLFCKCCQKIPHRAIYLDKILGLCLNVSGSIFILALFPKITPRARRNEDMWKTITCLGSTRASGLSCAIDLVLSSCHQLHARGWERVWYEMEKTLSHVMSTVFEVLLLSWNLTGPWEINECALTWKKKNRYVGIVR